MKRYSLSTIVGDGTDAHPFRPLIGDLSTEASPINYSIAIAPDHQTNPSKKWVLCVVSGSETTLTSAGTNSGVTLLPFGPSNLDALWTSIGTRAERNNFANAIKTTTGVNVTRDDPRTLREIVNVIGLAVDANFNASNLDIMDTGTV